MADAAVDRRYDKLYQQMCAQSEQARASAQKFLGALFQRYRPQSVLDVGCGIGAWLSTAREMGVADVRGVDGPWFDRTQLLVEPDLVDIVDLEQPLKLGRRFDLAICLETAEHLQPAAADTLVASLVRHAPVILFSAAIPYQRGPGHVNEQWPYFWAKKFHEYRYGSLDFIRCQFWFDQDVLWWYRQNTLLYVDYEWCRTQPGLWREGEIENMRLRPMDVVLPDLFFTAAKKLHELETALLTGGHYDLTVDDHRLIHLTRAAGDSPTSPAHVTISAPRRQPDGPPRV